MAQTNCIKYLSELVEVKIAKTFSKQNAYVIFRKLRVFYVTSNRLFYQQTITYPLVRLAVVRLSSTREQSLYHS